MLTIVVIFPDDYRNKKLRGREKRIKMKIVGKLDADKVLDEICHQLGASKEHLTYLIIAQRMILSTLNANTMMLAPAPKFSRKT